jgi:HD-GYP domain-containing protein (c-di-GMP phosphodiesterase class II)
LAACLSQVGKIFVPQAILTKPGQLEEAELRIVQRHVEHALEVIRPIDFDLPIGDAIGQMHERLDGSGYPNGLRGDQIQPLARVLGVVDVFCALTEARAHRYQLSVGKALLYLAENPQRYDVKVVRALAETVAAAGTAAEDATSAVRSGARAPVAAA